MKKVIYFLVVVATIFTGCNPLEDINAEIDAIPDSPNVGAFEYTLTDDDYSTLDLDSESFDSEDEAKQLIPSLLTDLYPLYGAGSSVLVNYNLFIGEAEGLTDFTGASTYTLNNDDYASSGSDAFGFYPNVDATDEIPSILSSQIPSPTADQVILAKYRQYFETPEVGLANFYYAEFPADYDSFELISISGLDTVGWTLGSSNVQGSGFTTMPNEVEEWLVTPEINLASASNTFLQLTQEIDFLGDAGLIDILVATDYITGGDINAANWTIFDFDKTLYADLTTSEPFDFSAYDGETIHIALKYSSTSTDAPRWRVQSLAVQTIGVSGETDNKGEFFTYTNSSWQPVDDVYYLSRSDYDSMGEASGQPGQFNNFSSSIAPDNYLPTFLELKYPFAQEGDQQFIIYDFFAGGAAGVQIRGNEYTVINGVWTAHQSTIQTSLQFGNVNGVWVPDNTIRYTLAGSDYAYIGTTYADVTGFSAPAASALQYSNFDRRPSNAAYWSDEMLITVFADLLANVIAPNAADDQKYVLIFDIYNGSAGTEEFKFIKTAGEWVINVD